MTYRERLWFTLLPNVILFLLALLIESLSLYLKKKKKSERLFAYVDLFGVCMRSTLTILCGIETPSTPAIFLAFGPFFSIIPHSLFPLQAFHLTECS